MTFVVKIVDCNIFLSLNDEVILISRYMSRVCDVMEDIYKNDGKKSNLIPWPPTKEGEK